MSRVLPLGLTPTLGEIYFFVRFSNPQDTPGIPIILSTGHSDTDLPEQAKEAGIKEFLIKPLNKQELAEAVRRVLDATKSS